MEEIKKQKNKRDDFKELVMDIQGFRDNNGSFIVKEIGIKSVYGDLTWHELVESAVPWNDLSDKRQKEANFNTTFTHGISWSDGCDKVKTAIRRVKFVILGANVIWAKGGDKCTTLRKLLNTKVQDLEHEGCPKAKDLPYQDTFQKCPLTVHHCATEQRPVYRCALQQAQQYAIWLKNHQMDVNDDYDSDVSDIEKYCCIHKCFDK